MLQDTPADESAVSSFSPASPSAFQQRTTQLGGEAVFSALGCRLNASVFLREEHRRRQLERAEERCRALDADAHQSSSSLPHTVSSVSTLLAEPSRGSGATPAVPRRQLIVPHTNVLPLNLQAQAQREGRVKFVTETSLRGGESQVSPVAFDRKHAGDRKLDEKRNDGDPAAERRAANVGPGRSEAEPLEASATCKSEEGKEINPREFVEFIRSHKSLKDEFCYMNRTGPYSYRIVPFAQKDPKDYLTLSSRGIAHYREGGETEYLSLQAWERDQEKYRKIVSIPFFANYQKWRILSIWKTVMREVRFKLCASILQKNLFSLDDILRKALLTIRSCGIKLTSWNILLLHSDAVYSLDHFLQVQTARRQQLVADLHKVRVAVTAELSRSCSESLHAFLEANGFTARKKPAPLALATCGNAAGNRGGDASSRGGFAKPDAPSKSLTESRVESALSKTSRAPGAPPSYTEKATTRLQCRKLAKFVKITEYLLQEALMTFVRGSTARFASILEAFAKAEPTGTSGESKPAGGEDEIPSSSPEWRGKNRAPGSEPKAAQTRQEAAPSNDKPLFLVYLEMDASGIGVTPTKATFRNAIEAVLLDGFKAVATMPSLTQAPEVAAFTEPVAPGDAGEESNLLFASVFPTNDASFLDLVKRVGKTLDKLFNQVLHTAEQSSHLVSLYSRCEATDLASFKENDLEAFDDTLARYREKIDELSAMPSQLKIGAFYLDTSNVRKFLLPSLKRVVSMIQEHLPTLASRVMATLLQNIKAANAKLGEVPTDIDSYVKFNAYLQEMRATTFGEYETRCAFVSEVFDLIKKYSVKIEATHKNQFVELSQALNTLRTQVQFAVYASETNTQRFFEELEAVIPHIEAKISESRMQMESEIFSTETADVDSVLAVLERMEEDIRAVTSEVERCRRCQEVLRTEASPFENFDDLVRNFGALKGLFSSKKSWANLREMWGEQAFAAADVRAIEAEVQTYAKLLNRFQRSLGANEAFLSMKADVAKFKTFLPVVLALRNPALQPRHWERIREFFDSLDLQSPSLLLKDLLAVDVAPFIHDILQIASDATAEKALESTLEAVKDTWASLQLVTTSYRASKDKVPILGSLEEVVATLDDSLATLATISGSRAAGPMQAEVEELHARLILLQETLEEWQLLQRNWLYLEAIFAAPDIRKQLPSEATKFAGVDHQWRELMKETQEYSVAFAAGTKEDRLEVFRRMNRTLDGVRKALEDYLQHKREAFPRFFFLSNDELLELLSQAKNLSAIQPLIRKCFANIYELMIDEEAKLAEIVGMISAEGEEVLFSKSLKPRGSVEKWLPEVEEMMVRTIRRNLRAKRGAASLSRREWINGTSCQVAACVAQIVWAAQTEEALTSPDVHSSLTQHYQHLSGQLQELTELVREDLPALERRTVAALAIQDLHNRDVVAELIDSAADSCSSFAWTQQLRHYWLEEPDACIVVQMAAQFNYGNEYLGAPARLVITPLTDRCWLTITSCLKLLRLSGSVAGPAGAGKTETVKELARMLGYFCLVFNCSESVDLYILEKVFAGVVTSGCWTCLDEFNRLDIEVLSVVAQQLLAIRHALLKEEGASTAFGRGETSSYVKTGKDSFLSASRLSKVKPSAGIFITMNPGYAGRAELPDNLKLLFRPISMVVPDYTSIAEILLFSEGFAEAKLLADKLIKFYKICSEQLSQQKHYDFGLRSVKTVLLLAGDLRRQDPEASEENLLLRAICDANEPKFVEEDLPLFYSTLADFFPSYRREEESDEEFEQAFLAAVEERGLQPSPGTLTATHQLSKLLSARVGTVLLGAPMSGKSTAVLVLADVLSRLSLSPKRKRQLSRASCAKRRLGRGARRRGAGGSEPPAWDGASFLSTPSCRRASAGPQEEDGDGEETEETEEETEETEETGEEADAETAAQVEAATTKQFSVSYRVVNPKALSIPALYGSFDYLTQEWSDGVASRVMREFAATDSHGPKWIIFDGPIDCLWIESMNTVLDDNQTLCLPNGERIKLRPEMRLLFEVTDLHAASPATVSRCGMLYFPSRAVSWESIVRSWLQRLPEDPFTEELREQLFEYFKLVVPSTLAHFEAETLETEIASPVLSLVASLCNILQAVLHIPLDPAAEQRFESGGAKEDQDVKAGRRRTTTTPFSDASAPASDRPVSATAADFSADLLRVFLLPAFAFSFIWSFGGALKPRASRFFTKLVEDVFQEQLAFPRGDDVFDFALNFEPFFGAGYALGHRPGVSQGHDGLAGDLSAESREDDREATRGKDSRRRSGAGRDFGEAKIGAGWGPAELEKARKSAHAFLSWETLVPAFTYKSEPYFALLVPTKESARAMFLLDKMIQARKSIFFTGSTSSGKTTVTNHLLDEKRDAGVLHTIRLCFSARTKAEEVQKTVESKLEKKRKNQLGPPAGRECVLFVDDVNLPLAEKKTGTQPAIELLRQFQEFKGFYDRKKIHWKALEKTLLLVAGAPPSSGRKPLPPRFCRHSLALCLCEPDNLSIQKMFLSILTGYFEAEGVKADISFAAKSLVDATIELYTQVRETFLPTPPRPVYGFNFRNVKKLFQGVLAAKKNSLPDKETLIRLWAHEACRTFYDRLMTEEDQQLFRSSLLSLVNRKFAVEWREDLLFGAGARLWGNFFSPEKLYEEAAHSKLILPLLETFRDELFASTASGAGRAKGGDTGDSLPASGVEAEGREGSPLVFFSEAVEHLFRLCRILMLPRENALLVGVGGTGKQTLFRLAAFIQETAVVEFVAATSSLSVSSLDDDAPSSPTAGTEGADAQAAREASASVLDQFRECEKAFLLQAGLSQNRPTAFLLTETQIVDDGLLEDINTLLSTGELSRVLDLETVDAIVQDLLPLAKETRRETSRESLLQFFYERVAQNLHVVLSMSPAGSALRYRLRWFPALLSCCTVDFFDAWRPDSLFEVAKDFFLQAATGDDLETAQGESWRGGEGAVASKLDGEDAKRRADLCVQTHLHASATAAEFLRHLKRPVYVTPKSFLDLLRLVVTVGETEKKTEEKDREKQSKLETGESEKRDERKASERGEDLPGTDTERGESAPLLFSAELAAFPSRELSSALRVHAIGCVSLLAPSVYLHRWAPQLKSERQDALQRQRSLLSNGLQRLHRTNAEVKKLREDLEQLEPILQKKTSESEQLLAIVESDRAAACSEQERVAAERKLVMGQQQEVALLQADAQKDVDTATPALEAALASLDALDKKDLTEMKSFAKPPPLVIATMEVVNLLLGEKSDWDTARKVLSDPALMTKLKNYDKDHISPGLLKKLDKLLQRSDYTPEQVGKQSVAAMSLCMWTLAIQTYAKVACEVHPKREKLAAMNEMLDRANAQLAEAEAKLTQVMAKVHAMEERLATLNEEKERLLEATSLCQQRLNRAGILTSGLVDEATRWQSTIAVLDERLAFVDGDAFLSAAAVCYFGPFTGCYRDKLQAAWADMVAASGVACAANFSLTEVLSDPIELRDWDLQGLPSDRTSLESGVLVRCAGKLGRAPLFIDPQQQAKKWTKNKEAENGLRVVNLSHPKLLNILTSAACVGQPVLIEDVGEALPPLLDPLLLLPRARAGAFSPVKIKIGEKTVEVDRNFSLFLSTKAANPHYLPEVALKVMLINFTVTPEGLEQQLLTEVVRLKTPDTEKRSSETLVQITKDKRALKQLVSPGTDSERNPGSPQPVF
ncbi:Dynein heavy chain family protein, related [Neospora caninum Liverpool]|uniref:Dynein heavy chain family protein, related n=1 Tax=Neospora caninum (strain Liverpool) TaxID=572307 RepID=F0VD74_NEOCL|nr:Dynein heavy chain family protein, related [Neospora caninum Liverpool]CBZ51589.1 Dynein heavy chain family protein, related [Neospora caninum Liverpool]|eukprot:XP_003881622.1 Dynein heavy chain family protein, related [Neospora caninum Liverpool]